MNLLFKNWMLENGLHEMASFNFGKHAGKQHTDRDIPSDYLAWMRRQLRQTGRGFDLRDRGRTLSAAEQERLLNQELDRRGYVEEEPGQAPPQQARPPARPAQQAPARPAQQAPARPPQPQTPKWIWAKSIVAKSEYGIPAPNLDLAMKQYDETSWMFVILDPEEGRLVTRGLIPTADIKNVVKSQRKEGQLVEGTKPSKVLEQIMPEKKEGSQTIPDKYITAEQKAIDQKFEQMLASPAKSHMVINALAGSGKTTVLKHLAWKYARGKPKNSWLYLVFNSKNKEEASGDFPTSVQVETTNGFAGREVLGNNLLVPTDRIQDYSKFEKARMVADSEAFAGITESLNIPNQIKEYGPDPKRLDSTKRNLWYTLRSLNSEFKMEALKLASLGKAFAIDPRQQAELAQNLQGVMEKYDLNTDMESIKEKVKKNSPWQIPLLSDLMGEDFMARNYTSELKQAATWLLHELMPHASKEQFKADADPHKRGHLGTNQSLGTVRDFDDDLWFSAIHANELRWPKYQIVLADEVQDFNIAQQVMLSKLAEAGAKIVAVGDPHQAIYRFRGADGGAFAGLSSMLKELSEDKDVEKGLTANFRSRQAIIDLANEEGREADHVSNLVKGRQFKEEPGRLGKGQATKDEQTYDDAFDTLGKEWRDMGEVRQTAFLSRTNEPLLHAALRLLAKGIPFIILGTDLAKELNAHITKLSDLFFLNKDADIVDLQDRMKGYNEEQQDKYAGKAAYTGKMKMLKEITEAMDAAIGQFIAEQQQGNIGEFRRWLESKFGGLDIEKGGKAGRDARAEYKRQVKELNPVILSTVHKSKGLQFHRVYILRDDMWPHPRSTREEDLEQEYNNKYIGRTRAEDELHILKLKGQPGYKEGGESEM